MAESCHQRMVMRILLSTVTLFAVFGGAFAACPAANNTCNYDVLKCCDTQFQQALGLSNCTGAFYFEPECHQAEIESLYAGGIQGLFKVCSAFTQFYQCLGPSAGDCTTINFHMKNGMDLGSAIQLISIYKQYGFACGAGLDAFANGDKCMSAVFTNSNTATQIAACRRDFKNNVNAMWDDRCTFFAQFNGCFSRIFRYSCGYEAGWWGCEYARQGGRTFLHECFEQCSATVQLPQSSEFAVQFDKKIFESKKKEDD